MSCYRPLKAWIVGEHPSGKPKYKITSYKVDHLEISEGHTYVCETPIVSRSVRWNPKSVLVNEYTEIPCGKCIGCRLDYSRNWANRCMLESKYHDSNYFVTLTYRDDDLHWNGKECDENGEISESVATLYKKDVQDFMKRLRFNYKYDNNIRFYACGEYGEKTSRPHYHALLFGLKLDDLKFYSANNGYPLYTSEFLEKTWKHGFVTVGELNWDTCAYTARYVMKKHKGKDSVYYENNCIAPEFVLMSRKPGIAYQYFEDNQDHIYEYDKICIETPKGGMSVKPSRYYDNLFDVDHHDQLETIKANRKIKAESYKTQMLTKTDLSYLDALSVQKRVKEAKIKSLDRPLL